MRRTRNPFSAASNGEDRAELANLLDRMISAGELHADALSSAVQAMASWAERPARADLERLEARLGSGGDERLRRLAIAALVAQADLPGGWSETRRERLREYQDDRSPLAAAAAQFTFPVEDDNHRLEL